MCWYWMVAHRPFPLPKKKSKKTITPENGKIYGAKLKPNSNHMDNWIPLLCGRIFVTFSWLLFLTKDLKCFKNLFTDLTQPQKSNHSCFCLLCYCSYDENKVTLCLSWQHNINSPLILLSAGVSYSIQVLTNM